MPSLVLTLGGDKRKLLLHLSWYIELVLKVIRSEIWITLKVIVRTLNIILNLTDNRCNPNSSGVMWQNFGRGIPLLRQRSEHAEVFLLSYW